MSEMKTVSFDIPEGELARLQQTATVRGLDGDAIEYLRRATGVYMLVEDVSQDPDASMVMRKGDEFYTVEIAD